MTVYKWFLTRIILPIGSRFSSGNYLENMRYWQQMDLKSAAELEKIQTENLNKILHHAKETVPLYKSVEGRLLAEFPILTKDILRKNIKNLISDDYSSSDLDQHFSSGSSGIQSFTYMTKAHTFFLRSLQTHWWKCAGYDIGDELLQFGISQKRSFIKKLKDLFFRCTYIKAFGLSDVDLKRLIDKFSTKRDFVIAGYPSVINELAVFCVKNDMLLKPKSIICFGDKLFAHHIKNFNAAFVSNFKLIDTYGCAEGLLMACKSHGEFYNIMSPHVYIEIVDDYGNSVENGTQGHVLVTCLTNKAMPLIRYKLGDLAIKLPLKEYPNSRKYNYPLLKKVIGRETDIVKTKNGTVLNVHSFTGVMEYFQEITQFKIIQNDLNEITIEYIAENDLSINGIIKTVENKLLELTNNSINIVFKCVKNIQPSPSGKPQIIESNLK